MKDEKILLFIQAGKKRTRRQGDRETRRHCSEPDLIGGDSDPPHMSFG
jgi:hypothetical protein